MRKIAYILFSVLLSLSVLVMPYPAKATTTTLTVAGDGLQNPNPWGTYYGGAANYTNLNSDDGDTSYIFIPNTGGAWSNYQFWTFSACPSAIINSVTFYYKVKSAFADGGFVWEGCYIGGTRYPTGVAHGLITTPQLLSYTWATNPATGLAWVKADVDSAQFGVTDMSNSMNITYMYLSIDYVATVPSVTSSAASSIAYSGGVHSATLNGEITGLNGGTLDIRGFVYGTTSNVTAPGNIVPPTGYTTNTTEGASAIGTFSRSVTGLTKGTTYYYRAYAHNQYGYAYGDQVSFTALNDPSITTSAVSQISSMTAWFNAVVVSDGGEEGTVRFLRGTASGVYTSNTTVTGTWASGETPYADITGLSIGTLYYVKAEITNSVSTKFGSEVTFTTTSGVSEPTNFVAIAGKNSMSLSWTKGVGANKTLIRYKLGSYPTGTTDGTSAYFDTKGSTVTTGLAAGTTYYVMAWGETSGFYSSSNATAMVTTLASTATAPSIINTPATPSMWFQSPDYTNMSNMPFYEIVNFAADSFEVPKSTFWYVLALIASATAGIIFYSSFQNANLVLSIFVVGGMIVVMSIVELVPLWNIIPFAIFAIVGIFVGERR